MFCNVLMPSSSMSVGLPLHPAGVEHPEHRAEDAVASLFAGEEQVARDVEGRGHGQGLVDGLDAGVPASCGTAEAARAAVDEDLPGVGGRAPDRHLISVDLPAPLSPITRQHLAGVELEVDAGQANDTCRSS